MTNETNLGEADFAPIWTDVSTCGSYTWVSSHAAFTVTSSLCCRYHLRELHLCLHFLRPLRGEIWKLNTLRGNIRVSFTPLRRLEGFDTDSTGGISLASKGVFYMLSMLLLQREKQESALHHKPQSLSGSVIRVLEYSKDLGELSSFTTEINPIKTGWLRSREWTPPKLGHLQAPMTGMARFTQEKQCVYTQRVFSPLTASLASCISREAISAHSISVRQIWVMSRLLVPHETGCHFST